MKTKRILIVLSIALIAFVAGRLSKTPATTADPQAVDATMQASAWTCSMHPQIQQPEAGDCPICGMDLIPLTAEGGDPGPRAMQMSESAMALAEIETSPVTRRFVERETRLVGRLELDETRERSLTARFPARVETLFVNFEGISVQQGDHLALVYSPELFAAQSELLTAYRHDPQSAMTHAAREKLRLWDLLPVQIDAILQRGSASERVEIKAPIGGIVVRKQVKEGDYLATGQPLFHIADLDVLWLKMEAFESDLPWLRYGQSVHFTVEAFPGTPFEGTVAFIEPEVDPVTRTVQVRVNVPNQEGQLKPGMFARGIVRAALAANGDVHAPDLAGKWISPMHPEVVKDGPGSCDVCGMDLVPAASLGYSAEAEAEKPLVIPASAVLQTGKRSVVYVRVPGADRPTFEGRDVVLGSRAGEHYVLLEGLQEGEAVVSQGAFKIDSALQIVAKPSMMNPAPTPEPLPRVDIPHDLTAKLLPGYLALQKALAADRFEEARTAVRSMRQVAGQEGTLAGLLHQLQTAEDLEGMRRPYLKQLSNALIEALRRAPDQHAGLYIMHCPMVYDDRGADWVQDDPDLLNPYFGASMLRCGVTKEVLGHDADEEPQHEH